MLEFKTEVFNSTLKLLPPSIADVLFKVSAPIKEKTDEIRLRSEFPPTLTVEGKSLFISSSGEASESVKGVDLQLTARDISESVRIICNNSIYAHTGEIKNGYISVKGGLRVGVAGNFSGENVYEFSSLNIRIARQIKGAAAFLKENEIVGGVLICGAPATGKTTVLRDLIRRISSGDNCPSKRVVAVDTRGELSAFYKGETVLDLGENTDVLFGVEKPRGIEMAVRCLNPQIVAFDEIGTSAELSAVRESLNSGVDIITTAHISCVEDLAKRPVTEELIGGFFVKTVVFLQNVGAQPKVYRAKELRKWIF